MSEENEKGKVYRLVIAETLSLGENLSPSTVQNALKATGSLSQFDQYYTEALGTLDKASHAGSMSPHDITAIKETLGKWRGLSVDYESKIIELTKKNEPQTLINVKKEIDEQIPDQLEMIQEMHEKMFGTETWKKLERIFDLPTSEKGKTSFFKDKTHEAVVNWVVKWIEIQDKEKLFGDIVHGLREAGIDCLIQVSSGFKPKFGIQVKNNDDVKETDFATKLKAQITESKKHKLQGLIIFLAADITEGSVEAKIRSILSDISQMDDASLKTISPERAFTIISQVIS